MLFLIYVYVKLVTFIIHFAQIFLLIMFGFRFAIFYVFFLNYCFCLLLCHCTTNKFVHNGAELPRVRLDY